MPPTLPASDPLAPDNSLRLIQGLSKARAYPHEITSFKIVETHISWVLLTGRFAYKIKKPVNFGFLDFSTLEKRRFFCSEELRLNRRLTANLYLDVVPITGDPDHPKIGGDGIAIEYAVKMVQFPENLTLAELAETGKLGNKEIDQIADLVAGFHESIESADEFSAYGNGETNRKWFEENFDHIRPRLVDQLQLKQLQTLHDWGLQEWRKLIALMQQRKQQGRVRECHGDVHLGNMTVIDRKVVLFDCIEFNPMLRWIDVISEVAFLMIDLSHSGYKKLSTRFLNRYLQHTGDYPGLALLRYYLVYRALVRAKVSLLRFEQQNDKDARNLLSPEYSDYMLLADSLTAYETPLLMITHGFSGSGKSAHSSRLAEHIGAIHILSDTERKRLFGFRATESTCSGIDSGLYTTEASQKTYLKLAELASEVISAGLPVIIDAAFLKAQQRNLFRKLADSKGARFIIIDFQASGEILQKRILQRRQQNTDPSEATIAVLKRQQQSAQALTDSERSNVISVNTENSDSQKTLLDAFAPYSKVQ